MTGAPAARSDGTLCLALHRGETARTPPLCASAAGRDGPLRPRTHGGKTTRPAVGRASALRGDGAPLRFTHRRKTARQAMVGPPSHGRDAAPQFWIHCRKATARFVFAVRFVAAAAAGGPIVVVCVSESALAPPGANARGGKPRLPCLCHNFSLSFSLVLGPIKINRRLSQ